MSETLITMKPNSIAGKRLVTSVADAEGLLMESAAKAGILTKAKLARINRIVRFMVYSRIDFDGSVNQKRECVL
jgi:hypothetical protein